MKLFAINYYYPYIYDLNFIVDKTDNIKHKLFELYSCYSIDISNTTKYSSKASTSQVKSTSILE